MELDKEEFMRIFAIFKDESEEHIQELNDGFLSLEKEPNQPSLLSELFRHSHSVKGAARMMGLSSVEKVAHAIETALGRVQKGEVKVDKNVMDSLYKGVDSLAEIIEHLSQGKKEEEIRCEEIIESLSLSTTVQEEGETSSPQGPALTKNAREKKSKNPSPEPPGNHINQDQEVPPSTPAPPASEFSSPVSSQEEEWGRRKTDVDSVPEDLPVGRRKSDASVHETIRVATKKLDKLMNQIGELLITKIKIDQRLQDARELIDCSEDYLNELQQTQKTSNPMEEEHAAATMDLYKNLLQKTNERATQINKKINLFYHSLSEDRNQMSLIIDELQKDIKKTRMLPFYTAVEVLPRMVRDIAQEEKKNVRLKIKGGEVELDKNILENIKDPLVHLIRNAIDHGIESSEERKKKGKPVEGIVQIRAFQQGDSIVVHIEDDGRGVQLQEVKKAALKKNLFTSFQLEQMTNHQLLDIVFQPGFSTSKILTDVSGRGVGMDVVRTNIEKLKGIIGVNSKPDEGTTFTIKLPLTMVTLQTLKVLVQGETYSIPTSSVETTIEISPEQVFTIEGQEAINYNHRSVPLVHMEEILEISSDEEEMGNGRRPAVILGSAEKRVAFMVDKLVGEDVVVAKALSSRMERIRNISGATILGDGRVSLILNISDLIESAQYQTLKGRKIRTMETKEDAKKSILVVEDSVTTRTLEVSILESAGYEVVSAADGQDAYAILANQGFDLIVTDIQMPYMDGFTFTKKVKSDQKYQNIPVILLTSLESPAEKKRGVEVGADAYIVKSSFDQNNLLDTITRLL